MSHHSFTPVPSCKTTSLVFLTGQVNHLSVSTTKSVLLRFHNSKRAASPIYTLGDSVLRAVSSASILGVQFTPSLDFSLHISNIVAQARRTLGFVLRTSKPCGPEAFCKLYTALVLPRLEYCSSVWNPYQLHLTNGLGSVQHRATLPRYEARLRHLGWQTLQHWRSVARVWASSAAAGQELPPSPPLFGLTSKPANLTSIMRGLSATRTLSSQQQCGTFSLLL